MEESGYGLIEASHLPGEAEGNCINPQSAGLRAEIRPRDPLSTKQESTNRLSTRFVLSRLSVSCDVMYKGKSESKVPYFIATK